MLPGRRSRERHYGVHGCDAHVSGCGQRRQPVLPAANMGVSREVNANNALVLELQCQLHLHSMPIKVEVPYTAHAGKSAHVRAWHRTRIAAEKDPHRFQSCSTALAAVDAQQQPHNNAWTSCQGPIRSRHSFILRCLSQPLHYEVDRATVQKLAKW